MLVSSITANYIKPIEVFVEINPFNKNMLSPLWRKINPALTCNNITAMFGWLANNICRQNTNNWDEKILLLWRQVRITFLILYWSSMFLNMYLYGIVEPRNQEQLSWGVRRVHLFDCQLIIWLIVWACSLLVSLNMIHTVNPWVTTCLRHWSTPESCCQVQVVTGHGSEQQCNDVTGCCIHLYSSMLSKTCKVLCQCLRSFSCVVIGYGKAGWKERKWMANRKYPDYIQ